MSKLTDYSKFDHLGDSDDERDEGSHQQEPSDDSAPHELAFPPARHEKHPSLPDRYIFYSGQQRVYEWEQSLDSITLYIETPPGKSVAKDFDIQITTTHLKVGLKGHDRYFLNNDLFSKVDTTESCWCLNDDYVLEISLAKQHLGETWTAPLKGGEQNPIMQQDLQKQLLLERFQQENPGMDFRGASFNGSVPDPRTFMGGIGYNT
jgi:hypothetical protein